MNGILAIDPGPTKSAYVLLDKGCAADFAILPNETLLERLQYSASDNWFCPVQQTLVIEGIACYGMPVGVETFNTCIWIGRFIEAWGAEWRILYRPDVKLHLCKSVRAKDSNVWQALVDRFGPGKDKAVGKKSAPGPLYGITSHMRSALAVAVTYHDQPQLAKAI
jgi:hypothetical protein